MADNDIEHILNRIADTVLSKPSYSRGAGTESRSEHFASAATQQREPSAMEEDPISRWDERQERGWGGLKKPEPQGEMPLERARQYVDPVFSPWSKFHENERNYLHGLTQHIAARGVEIPIQIRADTGMIFDGHHRLAGSELAKKKTIPYRFVDKDNNTVPETAPWSERHG